MCEIELPAHAEQDLKWFRKKERGEILDAIETPLRYEPTVETLNRRRLRPNQTTEWELRVGSFPVFYNVDDTVRIVSLEAIGLQLGNRVFFRGEEKAL